jgi:hypothetical protein
MVTQPECVANHRAQQLLQHPRVSAHATEQAIVTSPCNAMACSVRVCAFVPIEEQLSLHIQQISRALLGDDQRLRLPRFLDDEAAGGAKDPEATKQDLIEKIAQLNASIDEVGEPASPNQRPCPPGWPNACPSVHPLGPTHHPRACALISAYVTLFDFCGFN